MTSAAPPNPTAQTQIVKETNVTPGKPLLRRREAHGPVWRAVQFLGSLQYAIVVGSVFTVAMIIGTCIESWYSAKTAQDLIYNAWWFTLLLGMLACSIFFAAVKKWPWKRHQLGFLITHTGLLTMLAGGVLNTFFGVDAQMQLIDSAYGSERSGIPKESGQAFLPDDYIVTVQRQKASSGDWKKTQLDVRPGPLPWGPGASYTSNIPSLVRWLTFLASPLPQGVNKQIDADLQIEIIGHQPHVRVEPVEKATDLELGFPAIKLEINSTDVRQAPSWVVLTEASRGGRMLGNRFWSEMIAGKGEVLAEILGKCHPSLLEEFLSPPDQRGVKGQLVLALGNDKHRIDVEQSLGKTVPLGSSGWKAALDKYFPDFPNQKSADAKPELPAVEFRLTAPNGKETTYRVLSRLAMFPGPLDSEGHFE